MPNTASKAYLTSIAQATRERSRTKRLPMASQFSRRNFLPAGLKADHIEIVGDTIRIHSSSNEAEASCPRCGTTSRHVHSRYQRQPADLPAHGRNVQLALLVRRFRCRALCCPTRIFAERFPPDVTRPHTRRTVRWCATSSPRSVDDERQ